MAQDGAHDIKSSGISPAQTPDANYAQRPSGRRLPEPEPDPPQHVPTNLQDKAA